MFQFPGHTDDDYNIPLHHQNATIKTIPKPAPPPDNSQTSSLLTPLVDNTSPNFNTIRKAYVNSLNDAAKKSYNTPPHSNTNVELARAEHKSTLGGSNRYNQIKTLEEPAEILLDAIDDVIDNEIKYAKPKGQCYKCLLCCKTQIQICKNAVTFTAFCVTLFVAFLNADVLSNYFKNGIVLNSTTADHPTTTTTPIYGLGNFTYSTITTTTEQPKIFLPANLPTFEDSKESSGDSSTELVDNAVSPQTLLYTNTTTTTTTTTTILPYIIGGMANNATFDINDEELLLF